MVENLKKSVPMSRLPALTPLTVKTRLLSGPVSKSMPLPPMKFTLVIVGSTLRTMKRSSPDRASTVRSMTPVMS